MADTEVVVGAVFAWGDRKVLVAGYSTASSPDGLWLFPGGRVESGESDSEALVRTCQENLGRATRVFAEVGRFVTDDIELRLFEAKMIDDINGPMKYDYCGWQSLDDLGSLRWLPQHSASLHAVRDFVASCGEGYAPTLVERKVVSSEEMRIATSSLHVRVTGWNEDDELWKVVREDESGTRSAAEDVWGLRDVYDGIDVVWSRRCDLLVTDEIYAEMVTRGDAPAKRHPRCRS